MKKLSKELMKKVIGGLPDGGGGAGCSTASCLYYANPNDHSPISGKCSSLTGPMQTGCGCDGKTADASCNAQPGY